LLPSHFPLLSSCLQLLSLQVLLLN
jgi:hypothetical protein